MHSGRQPRASLRVAELRADLRRLIANSAAAPALRLVRRTINSTYRQDWRDSEALKRLLPYVLRSGTIGIDVGAHRGDFLRQLVAWLPDGRHIAYEPVPELAASLRINFPSADVRQAAAGDRRGLARFSIVPSQPGLSGFLPRGLEAQAVEVAVETLDTAVASGTKVSFIKIDAEGAELLVLKGALALLERDKPHIAFEHGRGGADHYQVSPETVHDLLSRHLGMRLFDLHSDGPLDRHEFRRAYDSGTCWNFLAVP